VIEEMKNDVLLLEAFFKNCGLMLNWSKTKFMVLKNNIELNTPDQIVLNKDYSITRVESHRFLGIEIDDKMQFDKQIDALINKLVQSSRVLTIIKHHLPLDMLLQFFHSHFMSHLNFCSFLLAKTSKTNLTRLQRLQNRCIKQIYQLESTYPTADLFRTVMNNTLPVLGICYLSLIAYIQKSLLMNREELLEFDVVVNNRRSNGELAPTRFKRRNRLGTDVSYLGVILYNQLPDDLKDLNNLKSFKKEVKKYLIDKIDLILSEDQIQTRRIS
jgi:hypothetical protein